MAARTRNEPAARTRSVLVEISWRVKSALVTGASRGIGRADCAGARTGRGAGHSSIMAAAWTRRLAVVQQIEAAGGRAQAIGADLSLPDGPHALADPGARLLGRAAGHPCGERRHLQGRDNRGDTLSRISTRCSPSMSVRPISWCNNCCQCLGAGASVVFTSSLVAHAAVGNLSAYAATKGAIDTIVKHFASILGPKGIRVNAVAPGIVDTDMSSFTKTEDGPRPRRWGCRP